MADDQNALEFLADLKVDEHDKKIAVYKVINKELINRDIYFTVGNYCIKWKNIFKLNMELLTDIIELMDEQLNLKLLDDLST